MGKFVKNQWNYGSLIPVKFPQLIVISTINRYRRAVSVSHVTL